jgi:hypothetical protein
LESFFYDVLARYGRSDIGVRILSDDTFPSFGFMVQGAANPEPSNTLWELWSAWKGDPIMSSRNHLMFVSYATFLLRVACGVEPLGFGFADGALVWPLGLGLLNGTQSLLPYASGSMVTPRGKVEVAWSTAAPPVAAPSPAALAFLGTLNVTFPVNLPAVVRFPTFGLPTASVVITEGATGTTADPRVFSEGAYVSGVDGVASAAVTPMAGGGRGCRRVRGQWGVPLHHLAVTAVPLSFDHFGRVAIPDVVFVILSWGYLQWYLIVAVCRCNHTPRAP